MIYIQSAFSQEEQRLELVGRQGEGGTRQLVFDCADVLAEYPDALIVCAMQRAGDRKAYLKDCATDGMNRAVTLESADVAVPGILKIELRALIGDDVRKSAVYIAKVAESLRGEKDRPGNPAADLLNRLDATLKHAEDSVSAADQAASAANTAATAATNAANAANSGEIARVAAEKNRASAETARANAETARANAETQRANTEGARATAEQGRVAAEQGRVAAEQERASAETARETAEAARRAALGGFSFAVNEDDGGLDITYTYTETEG